MRLLLLFGLILLFISHWGCEPRDEILTTDPDAKIAFSEDAVIFDTIPAGIHSITKRFKIYNPNNGSIKIGEMYVGGGDASPYEVIVKGIRRKRFSDVEILGKDSLLVLVEVEISPDNGNELIIAYDSLVCQTNGNLQNIKFLTWGENINTVTGAICDQVWTKEKPVLLMDSVLLQAGCTLTIEDSARVYAFSQAQLHIQGTLKVLGEKNNVVKIGGFRREIAYETVPGQWKGIRFYPESQNNEIQYAHIVNGESIDVIGTSISMQNTAIKNMKNKGIIAVSSNIFLQNCLVSNCINGLFEAFQEGNYSFNHCTMANYEFNFNREDQASLLFINPEGAGEMNVSIFNSIVWGNLADEVVFAGSEDNLNVFSAYSIYRSTFEFLVTEDNHNRINTNPLFVDEFYQDFRIQERSPAIDSGTPTETQIDLKGNDRDAQPDIGAYEYEVIEDE